RCREAFKDVPLIIGGIEASLRRIAHYDYWSDKVRRSILIDSKADLLVFGNGERQIIEIAHRLASGEPVTEIDDIRGTAILKKQIPEAWHVLDMQTPDGHFKLEDDLPNPYEEQKQCDQTDSTDEKVIQFEKIRELKRDRTHTVIELPAYEQVIKDKVSYAHASRVLHLETNPHNARALMQKHGDRYIWLNPPALPLSTPELDAVFELPYTRVPHHDYGEKNIPAYEMIRFSVNIMRGCFGGCTFCSITEHEGRIIQNRSEDSIIKEVEIIRDKVPGFTGIISDLGGPTANMYRLACKDPNIEAACRKPSCVFPDICQNLNTSHKPLIKLYKRARNLEGIKKILIASGLRYDIAVRSHEYIKELVTHHVGGYLKIAPEHTENGPLSKMMKPGMGTYYAFKKLFDKFSKEAGKEQYLIPYFIAAHPGTSDEDMMNLALWLKQNDFRADQVQTFLPSPMATASAMYYTEKNPLHKVTAKSEKVFSPRGERQRRLHKAFLRYHDPKNWPLLREALKNMGRADLIGNGKRHLIPSWQPKNVPGEAVSRRMSRKAKPFATQHNGLPKTPKVRRRK
ncbi:MAG: YgiQ family radical SAM protein, partial [Gammaproteobacteria bacterium]|nr:YgiQ family radical SAM protein [Gammaproteobacteria bacterium]